MGTTAVLQCVVVREPEDCRIRLVTAAWTAMCQHEHHASQVVLGYEAEAAAVAVAVAATAAASLLGPFLTHSQHAFKEVPQYAVDKD
ncbi:hypothetical protein O1611_g4065 [Lasiodiplodia mahajangana]|uniref:Uncharacterized protein n=1 Tax=Lasiodiplodia mahajangana TaxID=1108764 RepID=A0ACC2JQN0_9PEZI|nr:hypothetical protein O1611_g4065 [Lasiodiplodia mahajangana]